MYFRNCKTLSVFERKISLTFSFRVQISPRVKTMHNDNAWIFPPISLLNISVYRLQPRLFIDSLPYLKKKTKRTIKNYGSAARLDQAIVIKDKFLKILLLALSFSFSQYPEFLKFIGHIGPRGQKIMRSANNVGPHVRQNF